MEQNLYKNYKNFGIILIVLNICQILRTCRALPFSFNEEYRKVATIKVSFITLIVIETSCTCIVEVMLIFCNIMLFDYFALSVEVKFQAFYAWKMCFTPTNLVSILSLM